MGIQNQMSVNNANVPLFDFNVPLNVPFLCGSG